jgi:hypothetical protein
MFDGSGCRDGFVLSEDAIDEGSSARKALSMLMVRGIYAAVSECCEAWSFERTPLKPMHFSPISRMNSAIATPSLCGLDALVELYSAIIDSGEFIVIVAAVEMPSHDGRPSFRSMASSCMR